MSTSGSRGEAAVIALLRYEGWQIMEEQPVVYGHHVDIRAKHPIRGEALIEVKVWENPQTGKDTVKKAIADAYDLQAAGELTPYVLVLSQHLGGLHREMLTRAINAGAISEVRVIGFTDSLP